MRKYASIENTLAAFETLSDSDLLALRKYASMRLGGTQYTEPADLLYEALTRCLDGRRQWPLDLPFTLFLNQTMRSIADADRDSCDARLVSRVSGREGASCADPFLGMGHNAPSAEDDAIAAESARFASARAEELRGEFKGDPAARAVLDGWLAELPAKELMAKHSLSTKEYDAARKRVSRRAALVARRYQ